MENKEVQNLKTYSLREEKANYLTHALGVVIAIIATVVLLHRAITANHGWAIVAYAIYGFGMLACMLSSTVYHFVQEPTRKAMLRHFDHANIYVLIAASYSPLSLILLRNEGWWGWILFTLVWLFAIIGIGLNFGEIKTNNNIKTLFYVLMGMTLLIAIKPLINVASSRQCLDVLYWEAIGGVFYIAGSFIYALAKREFVHTVFHLFVLVGLVCHIVANYLIPF